MITQLELPYDILTDNETRNLFINWKNGDYKSKEKLILHNLRLVLHVIKKFDNLGAEINELIDIGTIGLIKAINSFKLEKNIKFATYSVHCIENEILMYIRYMKKAMHNISIETILGDDNDGNTLTLGNTLIDNNPNAEDIFSKKDDAQLLRQLVDELPSKHRDIVKLYFGFDNDISYNQKEISEIYQVSQAHISRVISGSVKKIKQKYLEYI